MTDESQQPSNADPFRKMAERIDHNKESGFGGACVFIPPNGVGDTIEVLLIDNAADPAQFYSTVATRIQIALDKLRDQNVQAQGFGRGR